MNSKKLNAIFNIRKKDFDKYINDIKINIKPAASKKRSLSNSSVYPAIANNQIKSIVALNETVYKLNF